MGIFKNNKKKCSDKKDPKNFFSSELIIKCYKDVSTQLCPVYFFISLIVVSMFILCFN